MFKYTNKTIDVKYEAGLHYTIEYLPDNKLKWTTLGKSLDGAPEAAEETFYFVEIAPNVFNLNWIEESGISVSQTINFETKVVYAFLAWDDVTARGKRAFAEQHGKIEFI